MSEQAMLLIAIVGAIITWTGSVVSLVVWLTGRFRSIEKVIYHEMDKHRREDDRQFNEHATKIQRLELKAFGFTMSGSSGGPSLNGDGL